MTAAEIQARIVKINAAIDAILNGNAQSYQIAGRALTRLSLETLERMLRDYEARLVAASRSGGRSAAVVEFGDPST